LGRPPARQRKPYSADTILDVAVRVFRERGYEGSSLEQIARAAGITKASIYYHVRSKEELLARGVGRSTGFATSFAARSISPSNGCLRSRCSSACAATLASSGVCSSGGASSIASCRKR
jgi:AcrR family transcriptional regulator